ncbi:MAG: alpha/beta hydrolase family protein [bacterium]|nr:alpha/beta hydrolase family protein [bacterium]
MALLHVTFTSACLKRSVPMQVILPVDGLKPAYEKPFKTLYLLHGLLGSCGDWINQTRIKRLAEAKNLCVIMPSGDNAFYVPQKDPHNDYGAFIGEELVDLTRRMFPLSHRREDTFIAGLSMGGFGALRNGLKYADTFGSIAGLSSALHFFETPGDGLIHNLFDEEACFGNMKRAAKSDKNPRVLAEKLAKQKDAALPRIYLACGTEDGLLRSNELFRDCLLENGYDLTWETFPGDHNWDFWDMTIQRVLEWLPLEDGAEGINSGHVMEAESNE